MEPKILFLGTGGDIAVTSKLQRASGGIIIQVDDCQFHLDPGPGALVQAARHGINVRDHTAILVSHAHLWHCNDVNAIIAAMTLNGMDKHGILVASESFLKSNLLTEFHKKCLEKIIPAKAGKKAALENVEIRTLETEHEDKETVGFKMFTPKFILSYTSDTKYKKNLVDQYSKSDILIINHTHPFGAKKSKTLNSDDVVKIIKKAKPKLAILTHFGKKLMNSNPIYEAREIQKLTGVQVIAAEDGMNIDPVSYSADMKQRTLNLYSKTKK
jgi:ribonuclease BN (tRNA processing enzyme)